MLVLPQARCVQSAQAVKVLSRHLHDFGWHPAPSCCLYTEWRQIPPVKGWSKWHFQHPHLVGHSHGQCSAAPSLRLQWRAQAPLRSDISNRFLAMASPCPLSSASSPQRLPGVSTKQITGRLKVSACFIRRSAPCGSRQGTAFQSCG